MGGAQAVLKTGVIDVFLPQCTCNGHCRVDGREVIALATGSIYLCDGKSRAIVRTLCNDNKHTP